VCAPGSLVRTDDVLLYAIQLGVGERVSRASARCSKNPLASGRRPTWWSRCSATANTKSVLCRSRDGTTRYQAFIRTALSMPRQSLTDVALAALPTQEECAQLVAVRIISHYHVGAEVAMIKYHGVDHACFEHLISLMSEERQEQVHASELFSSATWAWSPGSSSSNSSRPSKRSTTLNSPNVWETHWSARNSPHISSAKMSPLQM